LVLDAGSVILAAPRYALVGTVEPARDVCNNCVDRHRSHEHLLVVAIADPGEGVEGPDAATEAIVLWLDLVFVAVLVLVATVIFLRTTSLLYLPKG
jgi:hypothetical protein